MHGGFLWINKNIPINLDKVVQITGLPKYRVDRAQFFMEKEKYKEITNILKETYNLKKNNKGYEVASINDKFVCFKTKALASKVLQKCHPN